MIARQQLRKWIAASCIGISILSGCKPTERFRAWKSSSDVSYFQNFVTQIEYPDLQQAPPPVLVDTPRPLTIENPSELQMVEMTLQQAIQSALASSEVLRNLGGSVVNAPFGIATQLDPALTDLNPLGGVEAALAAFDAQVSSQLFWAKTNPPRLQGSDSIQNLFILGFGQTQGVHQNQVQKRTASGAVYALRSSVRYNRFDLSNPNRGDSFFTGQIEAEYRQPLLRGAGTTYNRIAGNSGIIGQYNGVLIARLNTDISLTDFEAGVIQLLNDVETAYWELYFAYRALDAQVLGRESVLGSWQRINELKRVGVRGGEANAEAQARSSFYLFSSQLNDALAGTAGLYAAEQRLRYIMGLPASDGRLIKPIDEPLQAEVEFDWQSALCDAITQRVEIRRQEWTVKRRELELIAARLNRRARLDALSQYRWRGAGDDLFQYRDSSGMIQNLASGTSQEWQSGLEWQYAIGQRQASAAVRHAQLSLARDLGILKEQQLRITHDLSNASRQVARGYLQMRTNYNRTEADKREVEVLQRRFDEGLDNINFVLQARQRLATSTVSFYRSLIDYNLSLRDFHREKGSLLIYNQVNLSEEALNGSAIQAAYDRGRYFTPRDNPERVEVGGRVSNGGFNPSSVGIPSYNAQPIFEPSETLPE